jgi:hypothetical protein
MTTQPKRPAQNEETDEDLKRILDEHAAAAERDTERFTRQQIREGASKLKRHAPQ